MKVILCVLNAILLFPLIAVASPTSKIEIGVSLPLSGPLSGIGQSVMQGMKLAVARERIKFENIELIFDDNKYDAKIAVASFENLYRRPHMQIVYVWGSPTCMAVLPVAERNKKPLVCFSGDPKPNFNFAISFNNPASDYAKVMAEFLKSKAISKVGIVYSEIPFYRSLADELEHFMGNYQITRESVLPDLNDFATIALRQKKDLNDSLALFLLPSQIPLLIKQNKLIDYKPLIIGADTFSDIDAIKQSAPTINGAAYVDIVVPEEFAVAYKKHFNSLNNVNFAFNGYSYTNLISEILEGTTAILDSELLLSKLRQYSGNKNIKYVHSDTFGQYFSFPIELKAVDVSN